MINSTANFVFSFVPHLSWNPLISFSSRLLYWVDVCNILWLWIIFIELLWYQVVSNWMSWNIHEISKQILLYNRRWNEYQTFGSIFSWYMTTINKTINHSWKQQKWKSPGCRWQKPHIFSVVQTQHQSRFYGIYNMLSLLFAQNLCFRVFLLKKSLS